MTALVVWPKKLGFVVCVLAILFMSLVTYLVFLEPPWLSYTNLPFPVLNGPVKAGTTVSLHLARCSTSPVTRVYSVSRVLKCGGVPILLPATVSTIEPGCNKAISNLSIVPESMLPGTCHLEGYAEIQGMVRSDSIKWESQEFEVIR